MPIIQVQMLSGRSADQKRALIAGLACATARALAVPEEAIRVVLTEVPPEHWGVGGHSMAELRSASPAVGEASAPDGR